MTEQYAMSRGRAKECLSLLMLSSAALMNTGCDDSDGGDEVFHTLGLVYDLVWVWL